MANMGEHNKQVVIAGKVVRRYNIITTKLYVYDVYEKTAGVTGEHSTITTIDGIWYGRVGTRRLTPELDSLPTYTVERSNAVHGFLQQQYDEAYALIHQAFPESISGRHDIGDIEVVWND